MSSDNTTDPTPISHIQALYFELIRTIRYNELDGRRVVDLLLEWRPLWESVIADRQPTPRFERGRDDQYDVYPPLSLLRTTKFGDWPADTFYIWTDEARLPRLRQLIEEHWRASEIELVDQEDLTFMFHGFYRPEYRVLMVWWD